MSYKYPRKIETEIIKPELCSGCPAFHAKCVTSGNWNRRARISFIAESPSWTSIGAQTPLVGRNGLLLHKVVQQTISEFYEDDFTFYYNTAYAAGAEGKPLKIVTDHCKSLWQTQWSNVFGQHQDLHVLVPLGLIAAKSCGVSTRKITEARGKTYDGMIGSRAVKVIPTFSLQHLGMKPGLTRVFQADIRKAIDLAYFNKHIAPKTVEELSVNYVYPRTIEEVKDICDYIIHYVDISKQTDPWKWPISVDTETNTLRPYAPDAKVLMISFGWDDGFATAIVLDHPEVMYDPAEAWTHVSRVLECPKPKTFHNAKFDLQFLELTKGIRVNNFSWDTLLGEHWLDEDRKGVYSLKAIAPLYVPEYQGYEDDLHAALRGGEKIDTVALEGEVDGLDYWEEGEIFDSTAKATNNDQWLQDPRWPPGTDPRLIDLYKQYRTEWFEFDEAENGKARGVAWRRWKRVAKDIGVLEPTPVPKDKLRQVKDFTKVDIETLLPYAAIDADVTRQIHKRQLRRIHHTGHAVDAHNVMRDLYVPGSIALGRMEFVGAKIDLALASTYEEQLTEIIETTRVTLHELALQEFNIQSLDELGSVMRGCGFKIIKTTEKDNRMSITKDVLFTYQQTYAQLVYPDGEPEKAQLPAYTDDNRRLTDAGRLHFVETLLLHRAAHSMCTKFIKKLRELSQIDGHIHTSFHLSGTSTGRLSSSQLNLQNIPLYMCRLSRPNVKGPPRVIFRGFNVKALIIPEDADEVFWNLDIQAAEIRVLCYESGDTNLINAVNAGADIHTVFLTKIKHPDLEPDLTDPEFKKHYDFYIEKKRSGDPDIEHFRTGVKRTVFGTLYGAGAKKVAEQLGDESPAGIAFAESIRKAIFDAFPTILNYIKRTEQEVMDKGYVGSIFGRYRRFWLAIVSSFLSSKAKREAVNFKIQSPSSDLVLQALCRICERIKEIGGVVRLTVHDSIAGTIKKKNVHLMRKLFDELVTAATKIECGWLPVLWVYDLEIGPNYGVKTSYDKYLATVAENSPANKNEEKEPESGIS